MISRLGAALTDFSGCGLASFGELLCVINPKAAMIMTPPRTVAIEGTCPVMMDSATSTSRIPRLRRFSYARNCPTERLEDPHIAAIDPNTGEVREIRMAQDPKDATYSD